MPLSQGLQRGFFGEAIGEKGVEFHAHHQVPRHIAYKRESSICCKVFESEQKRLGIARMDEVLFLGRVVRIEAVPIVWRSGCFPVDAHQLGSTFPLTRFGAPADFWEAHAHAVPLALGLSLRAAGVRTTRPARQLWGAGRETAELGGIHPQAAECSLTCWAIEPSPSTPRTARTGSADMCRGA
jgi:hypothetical protein